MAVEALEAVAVLIIIPLSGWEKVKADKGKKPEPVTWSRLLRNSTGILRNVSSEGLETRTKIRSIEGLVDSLVWIIRAAIAGDNRDDINNKVWLELFYDIFLCTKLVGVRVLDFQSIGLTLSYLFDLMVDTSINLVRSLK